MDDNNTVYPTHHCFNDAMEFIDYVALEFKGEDMSAVKLVHGLITGDDGTSHSHAWVEDSSTEVAIFAGIQRGEKIYFFSPLDEFYKHSRVTETTKYSIPEALAENLRTLSFGPWEPKYIALCGDGEAFTIGGGEMKIGTIGKLPTRKEVIA